MQSDEIRTRFLKFFEKRGHAIIPSASLVPENDPSVLFTTAGMQPLVPYLLGAPHPKGKRLVNSQKCVRTQDIDEVGDNTHDTFFEMLGNWSLGDYFKEDAIKWSYEFLTSKEEGLGLDPKRLYVTVFGGNEDAPKDTESYKIWKSLGVPENRIYWMDGRLAEKNWWSPGDNGPCGPDTEMFYDVTGKLDKGMTKEEYLLADERQDVVEIWNDVFMEYEKKLRIILVDAVFCLVDMEGNVNEELEFFLAPLSNKKIILTNAPQEKHNSYFKNIHWDIFSLSNNPNKKNPTYYRTFLKEYNLKPDEVLYVEHDEESAKSAQSVGINTLVYTGVTEELKKFVYKNRFKISKLKKQNVDTGAGLERLAMVMQKKNNIFDTDLFKPFMDEIKKCSTTYDERAARIVADHIRTAVFMVADGVIPSNTDQGYVLRRLVRRAARYAQEIGIENLSPASFVEIVAGTYKDTYPYLVEKKGHIAETIYAEGNKFRATLTKGMQEFKKISNKEISGKDAFVLFSTYGFPLEVTVELAREKGITVDEMGFQEEMKKHQELSRAGAEQKFKGGLADTSEKTTMLHTSTHLMLAGLRKYLGDHVHQAGSNITQERTRFDFTHPEKVSPEILKKVEDYVNEAITKECIVVIEQMLKDEAQKAGVEGSFWEKYPDVVNVYMVKAQDGTVYSRELCGGPHVKNTSQIGHFKIIKEEAVAAGIRRIKAVVV